MHKGLDIRENKKSNSISGQPPPSPLKQTIKKTTATNTFSYTLIDSRSHFVFNLLHYVHLISVLLHTMSQQ